MGLACVLLGGNVTITDIKNNIFLIEENVGTVPRAHKAHLPRCLSCMS